MKAQLTHECKILMLGVSLQEHPLHKTYAHITFKNLALSSSKIKGKQRQQHVKPEQQEISLYAWALIFILDILDLYTLHLGCDPVSKKPTVPT
jgi:hypothetical protein